MSIVKGKDAKLKYKVGGIGAGGSWVDLTIIKDVAITDDKDEVEVGTRAEPDFKIYAMLRRDISLSFMLRHQTANAGFQAIRDAFLDGDIIGIQVLDADSGEGIQADMEIKKFDRNDSNDDILWHDVEARPAVSDNPPSYIGA